jgi:hypothetical protein
MSWFRRALRDDLFGEMLADGFAFAIRVGGEIDRLRFFGSFLQLLRFFESGISS